MFQPLTCGWSWSADWICLFMRAVPVSPNFPTCNFCQKVLDILCCTWFMQFVLRLILSFLEQLFVVSWLKALLFVWIHIFFCVDSGLLLSAPFVLCFTLFNLGRELFSFLMICSNVMDISLLFGSFCLLLSHKVIKLLLLVVWRPLDVASLTNQVYVLPKIDVVQLCVAPALNRVHFNHAGSCSWEIVLPSSVVSRLNHLLLAYCFPFEVMSWKRFLLITLQRFVSKAILIMPGLITVLHSSACPVLLG